jgi:hypothetical protein
VSVEPKLFLQKSQPAALANALRHICNRVFANSNSFMKHLSGSQEPASAEAVAPHSTICPNESGQNGICCASGEPFTQQLIRGLTKDVKLHFRPRWVNGNSNTCDAKYLIAIKLSKQNRPYLSTRYQPQLSTFVHNLQ